jgi:hypothetical protein
MEPTLSLEGRGEARQWPENQRCRNRQYGNSLQEFASRQQKSGFVVMVLSNIG